MGIVLLLSLNKQTYAYDTKYLSQIAWVLFVSLLWNMVRMWVGLLWLEAPNHFEQDRSQVVKSCWRCSFFFLCFKETKLRAVGIIRNFPMELTLAYLIHKLRSLGKLPSQSWSAAVNLLPPLNLLSSNNLTSHLYQQWMARRQQYPALQWQEKLFLLWNIIVNPTFSMADEYPLCHLLMCRLVYTILSLLNLPHVFACRRCLSNINSGTCCYSKLIVNWTCFSILIFWHHQL